MIYRIAVVCEKPHLFYTKDLFKSFYELLANFKAIQSIKSNDPTWFEAINAIHDDVVYIFRTYFRLSSNLRAPRDNPPPNYTQHSMTTDNEQYSAASEKHNLSAVGSIDSSLHYHDSTAMETATEAASNMTSTVKRRNKTYSEDDLFFDKTHSVRVQAYISSTAAGKNPDRYPALNKSELSYADLSSDSDNRLGIDTDSDASSAGAGSNGVGAEGSKYNISGFKSWNSKVTESVNSLIVNNKRFVVEWLITQFQRFVEFKKARTLNDSNASDGNDDQGMDDTDYLLQLDSSILQQCTSDSDLINLFELFRVNKSLTLANCYVISGLETIQDFSEHIELLDSVLHPITALPVSVGSKNKCDANRSSKPRSKKLSKKRHKKSRKDEGVDVAAMQSILSSDRFDSSIFTSAPNSTLQITNNPVVSFNLTSNANSNSNTNSSTNSNGKVTSTRSGIDSIKNTFIDSDSDVDPDAIFSGSNKRSAHSSRSKLLQPYLDSDSSPPPSPANTSGQQGTDETDDIGTSVSNKPRTRSSARSRDAHTDDKVNSTATGQRVGGSSSTQDFKQRALLLRRKLIKKKRVLVRKSKID
ncbi:hypothetical protein AX774_g2137 [Zancudomyces culisetae]|uniref:Uncharacterized protein n=1 Tax=Zancudomyces culisetae TaxID=1213189 RepID=A0A1R1PTR0_ZANCU|nr:hypothetical protein AX774_g2137 [Zancudomyces culisetae]|eukprot:OMH84337.1 hypothetical protein AX774_g2137 [Zancudomyces culisetae]